LERILLAIENKTNAQLISDLLKDHFCIIAYEKDNYIASLVDLVILDGNMLSYFIEENIILKGEVDSIFLPILLITTKEEISMISSQLWQTVDEVISMPIAKMELFARIEILLRARRLTIQLFEQNLTLTQKNNSLVSYNKNLESRFSNMSHELKTPLAIILSGIDLLSTSINNELPDLEILKKTLDISKKSSHRLLRIINNLLDLTKIDSGYMKLNLKNINLHTYLSEIIDSVQIYANEKEIELILISDPGCGDIALDESFLDRIMLNLLSNAIKYTPAQGRVCVMMQNCYDKGKVIITVKDNGIGIPKDKQNIIFDRFVQIDDTMSKRSEGCGLGLSLVKSLVELHNGRVWVESKLGMGSIFSFELPIKKTVAYAPQWENISNIQNLISYEFSEL
jgi:signal transduction histidine kinase